MFQANSLRGTPRPPSAAALVLVVASLTLLSAPALPQDLFVDFGDEWTFWRGDLAPSVPADAWRLPGFDDVLWETGATGIGYGDGDDATVLDDMEDNYVSVFTRKTFDVPNPAALTSLLLAIDFDDSFICYINGVEVARSNITDPVDFTTTADGNHEAGTVEYFDVTGGLAELTAGENLIAVEIHNTSLTSSDLSFNARLTGDDPRADCPTVSGCDASFDGITISWTPGPYDSVIVTRNGEEIPGSPFPPNTDSALDPDKRTGNVYEIIATIAGVQCDPLTFTCTSIPTGTVLIDDDEEWRFFRGTAAPSDPPEAWREPLFDDDLWETGATGIGYSDGDDATVLDDMEDAYLTVFCRKEFQAQDVASINNLILEVDYDDGIIAFLNGTEVARSGNMGLPGQEFAFDQTTTGGHEAGTPEQFDLTPSLNLLQDGTNLLAVQVHNTAIGSSDLSFIPRLLADSCPAVGGLACAYDDVTGEVTVSWDPAAFDSYEVTRNGVALPNTPLPGDAESYVDTDPGTLDATYEVTGILAGFSCSSDDCEITCDDRDPGLLTCVLSLVDGSTQAQLSWAPRAGATEIEIIREGTSVAMLAGDADSYLDPDVESDEPEDDTDFDVIFTFAGGETCTISCNPSLCPQDFTCAAVDDGGVLRPHLTWTNMVKEWESISIERDGVEIASGLPGDTTSFFDDSVALVFGTAFTYDVFPIAPPGEDVGTTCDMSCTVSGPIVEVGEYDAPQGGWDYRIDFAGINQLAYEVNTGVAGNLDGSWIRSVDLDSWDGTAPDEVGPAPDGAAPGGLELGVDGSGSACGQEMTALRILNPGNTNAPGGSLVGTFPDPFTPPNNSSILLGFDAGVTDSNLLRDGVTFAARWRIHPNPPEFLNAQPTGDGLPLAGGVGQIGFYYRDSDAAGAAGATAGLAFTLQSGDLMQMSTEPVTTVQAAHITTYRSVWVTVEDPEGDESYDVTVYVNGEDTPFASLTAVGAALQGGTGDFGAPLGNYLAVGAVGDGQDADVQIDFVAYKEGVHAPSTTPCEPSDNNRPTARITASPSTTVTLAGGSAQVTLDGSTSDDGDGGSQGLTYQWAKLSGPPGDTIGAPTAASTQVTFTQAGNYVYQLRVDDGQPAFNTATATVGIAVLREGGGPTFVRGDGDSSGRINLSDGIVALNWLFTGGGEPACLDAADTDDSGTIVLTDAVRIFNWLFTGGPAPVDPMPSSASYLAADCAEDPTPDRDGDLGCATTANICP